MMEREAGLARIRLVKLPLVVGVFLTLTACIATTGKYEKKLASWFGQNEQSLIAGWGPPQQVYESGGFKYLTYDWSGSAYIPGTSPTYQTQFIGNTAYTTSYGGSSAVTLNLNCRTTFTLQNGVVSAYRFEGNRCVSR